MSVMRHVDKNDSERLGLLQEKILKVLEYKIQNEIKGKHTF